MIHSVMRTCGIHLQWPDFEKLLFISSFLTIDRVMNFIQICPSKFIRGCLISESQCHEILSSITNPLYSFTSSTLIVSGFVVMDQRFLASHSSHPSKYLWLNPALESDRTHTLMINELKDMYKTNCLQFPFIIYKWTKFSPGMLGLWLKNFIKGDIPLIIEHLIAPIIHTVSCLVEKEPDFFSQYWRECFNLKTTDLFQLPCPSNYEDCGAIIHTSVIQISHSVDFLIHLS